MQTAFDFGRGAELLRIREALQAFFGCLQSILRRQPIGQLVKSLISSRTRDAVSLGAYEQLIERYPGWSHLAAAPVDKIRKLIADVTFPDDKARYLHETLRLIAVSRADFDLGFLKDWPVDQALIWLELLPGVGRKVSASTLNFSTLNMPAFVVDTHILRVLGRLGIVGADAATRTVYEAVMEVAAEWEADQLAEFHVLLKHLGQTLCRADRACCRQCPLRRSCHWADRANGPIVPMS